VRVYSEDPTRNFLPSIGRLVRYRPPEGPGLRLDTGVDEGAEISLFYDPMIAKLVASGADRGTAIDRLRRALDGFYIAGVQHNLAFLAAVAANRRFRDGALSTGFLAEEFPGGFAPPAELGEADRIILVAAVLAYRRVREQETAIAGGLAGAEVGIAEDCVALIEGRPHSASARPDGRDYTVEIGRRRARATTDWRPGQPLLAARIGDKEVTVQVERAPGSTFRLAHGGAVRRVQVLPPRAAELLGLMPQKTAPDTGRLLLSPMPGLLSAITVTPGQEIKAGEPLAVVEAMKMENVLRAERDGRIARIRAKPGDSLAVDAVILEFE
jgi:propionyl-CoA carboxylase alpha chain